MKSLISKMIFSFILSLMFVMFAAGQESKKTECPAKDYDCLIKKYTAEIEASPDDARLYYLRGHIFSIRANYKRSNEDLDRAIKLKPDFIHALSDRARNYGFMELPEESLKDENKILALDEDNPFATVYRGISYRKLGEKEKSTNDYLRAIEILNREIPLYSQDYERYMVRGIAYQYLGEYDKAINDFFQSNQINPSYFQTYFYRGLLYIVQENYALALDNLTKCIEYEPDFAEAYRIRSLIYFEFGEQIKSSEDRKKYRELSTKE